MNQLVNVVVVTYQEYHRTEKCLASLLACGYENLKIYLVDNNSDKKIYEKFYKKYKNIKNVEFVRSDKNYGFGEGCNLAIRRIKSGYIVFLNNDTVVERNWLEPVVRYLDKNPKVGACQPKIKNLKNKKFFEYAGAAGGMMDVYGYPFSRGRIFFTLERDKGQYDDVVDLVWCSGTAMITRKKVLDEVGNFDNIFFMYGEEADLCWRINHAGYKLVFIPQSVVYHIGGGTMKRNPSYRKTYLSHRNGLILLLKNYTVSELVRYIGVRFILDMVTFSYYLFKTPLNYNWFAIILAYLNVIIIFPIIFKKHFELRTFRLNSKTIYPPLYKRSIVVDYFILGKRTFKQLDEAYF